MGACYDEMRLDGSLNMKQVEEKFKEYQNECAHESGNSYSGRLNMCPGLAWPMHKTFDSYQDAYNFIEKTAQKWESALAVTYRMSGKMPKSKALDNLVQKIKQIERQLITYQIETEKDVEKRLKSREFIKCGHCKSHLDTRFSSRTLKCPVCFSEFLTKKQLKKIKSLTDKLSSVKSKYELKRDELYSRVKGKGELMWLIGGICSS